MILESEGMTRTAKKKAAKLARQQSEEARRAANDARKAAQAKLANSMNDIACSEPWWYAVVIHKQAYAPSFKCQCSDCRTNFPGRLDPEPARESMISTDCQEAAQAPDEDQIRGMAKTMLMVMSEDEVVEKILSIFPELEMEFVFPGRQKFYGGTVFIPAKRNAGTIRRRKPILDWDNPT